MFPFKKAVFNLFTNGRYGIFEDSVEKKEIQQTSLDLKHCVQEIETILVDCEKKQYLSNLALDEIANEFLISNTLQTTINKQFLLEAELPKELINKYSEINFPLSDYFKDKRLFQHYEKEVIRLFENVGYQLSNHELTVSSFQKKLIASEKSLYNVAVYKSFYQPCKQLSSTASNLPSKYKDLLALNYKTFDSTSRAIKIQISLFKDEVKSIHAELDKITKAIVAIDISKQEEYLKAIGISEQFIEEYLERFSSQTEKTEKYQLGKPIELKFSENFSCVLRKYQAFGVKYLLQQKKLLIGDEMGLGKTIQALSAVDQLFQQGLTHVLIIVPASLVPNWETECSSKTKYSAISLMGSKRKKNIEFWQKNGGIGLVSYTTFGNDVAFYDTISNTSTPETTNVANARVFVIADEAEYVKNPDTQRSQAFKKLANASEYVLLLTGTPMQNRYGEFRQLIAYLDPELSNSLSGDPITFREQVKLRYLRRNRVDVLHELPEKVEQNEWVELTDEEAKVHLTQLQEKHFMQYRYLLTTETNSKIERLLELVKQHKASNDKILIFSFFRNTIEFLDHKISESKIILHGGVDIKERANRLEAFLNSQDISIALCQILATGRGLNIQGANAIIIVEPQLNPALEDQAISRVYRMGQRKMVMVHRLIGSSIICMG